MPNNLSRRVGYKIPIPEIIDQLESVFAFDWETCNDQEFAEAYAAVLYDVNCLQDWCGRDLTPEEI